MLREGRIAEGGTHAELLRARAAPTRRWSARARAPAPRAAPWAAHERRRRRRQTRARLGTLRLLARALRYVAPFRGQFAWKLILLLISMLPLLVLPWPAKIVLDHVVEGILSASRRDRCRRS